MTARVWMLTLHANCKHTRQMASKQREKQVKHLLNELLSVFGHHAISLNPLEASAVTVLIQRRSRRREASTSSESPLTCLKSNSAMFIFSFRITWLKDAGFFASCWILFPLHLQYFWVLWEFLHGSVHGGSRRAWTSAGFPWTRL